MLKIFTVDLGHVKMDVIAESEEAAVASAIHAWQSDIPKLRQLPLPFVFAVAQEPRNAA